MQKRVLSLIVIISLVISMTGCSQGTSAELSKIPRNIYQKNEYKTEMVFKGDIVPTLNLTLKPMEMEQINYSVSEVDLEVDEILVNVGDRVSAGQTLITFKSEDIKKNIDKYSNNVIKNQLLLSHYERVNNIDRKDREDKYGVILQELQDNLELSKLYLEEEQARYAACQIIAEKEGIITFMSNTVLNGVVEQGQTLVIENCGDNLYESSTDSNYEINVGEVYSADLRDETYKMRIIDISEGEDGRNIIFEPVDGFLNLAATDKPEIKISQKSLSGVVYVDKSAVQTAQTGSFVYVVEENGFLRPVYIEIGEEVDDYIVVKSGLVGNEEVAIK